MALWLRICMECELCTNSWESNAIDNIRAYLFLAEMMALLLVNIENMFCWRQRIIAIRLGKSNSSPASEGIHQQHFSHYS